MPQNTSYASILPLITTPRLSSFITTFKPVHDFEIYGVYIWAQHAASSIYPLLQNLEVSLRNSIDREATRRFGLKWWNNPCLGCKGNIQLTRFYAKIKEAVDKLDREWKQERYKRHESTINPPEWSHDKIIAATDFSAWHFILKNEFFLPCSAHMLYTRTWDIHIYPATLLTDPSAETPPSGHGINGGVT